jgi:hypothetical protein
LIEVDFLHLLLQLHQNTSLFKALFHNIWFCVMEGIPLRGFCGIKANLGFFPFPINDRVLKIWPAREEW